MQWAEKILSEALGTLSIGGSLTTLGYAAGRKTNHRRHGSYLEAGEYEELLPVLTTCGGMDHRMERHFSIASIGAVQAHRGKDVPAAEAADALRYLVEGRPFGRVVLTI